MIYLINNNHCILCYSFFFNLIISYQHQLFLVDEKKLFSNHIFVLSLFLSHLGSYKYTSKTTIHRRYPQNVMSSMIYQVSQTFCFLYAAFYSSHNLLCPSKTSTVTSFISAQMHGTISPIYVLSKMSIIALINYSTEYNSCIV